MDKKGYDTLAAIMTTDTYTDAAKALGISRFTLYARMEKYAIREYIDQQAADALSKIKLATPKAAQVLVSGLEDKKNKYDSAKEVLDRGGVSAKKQLDITSAGKPILGSLTNVSSDDGDPQTT